VASIVRCDRCNYEGLMATDENRRIYTVPAKWAKINDLPILVNVVLCPDCVKQLVAWIRPEKKP
jgi:hypothetical protein